MLFGYTRPHHVIQLASREENSTESCQSRHLFCWRHVQPLTRATKVKLVPERFTGTSARVQFPWPPIKPKNIPRSCPTGGLFVTACLCFQRDFLQMHRNRATYLINVKFYISPNPRVYVDDTSFLKAPQPQLCSPLHGCNFLTSFTCCCWIPAGNWRIMKKSQKPTA